MTDYPDELWRSVADLSGLLLGEETQDTTMKRVSDLAVRSIAHCDAVGVTLCPADQPVTRAATGGLVYEVDHYQYDINEGPCLQSLLDHAVITVEDMATETRWPRFCRHAADRGIHSSVSIPLLVRGEGLGALNLYAFRPGAFDAADREMGTMFAAQAAAVLSNARTYAASVELAATLRTALDSRAVIDQAMGILMGQNGYSQELAFDQLRSLSQRQNRKLHLVAAEMAAAAASGRMDTDGPTTADAPE